MFDASYYDEIKTQLQAQYRDTNIDGLISGFLDVKKKYVLAAARSLFSDNFSLSTAKGVGLDLWGNLLRMSRYVPSESEGDGSYNYFNFNSKNFNKLNFYNYNKPEYSALEDAHFNELLLIIYRGFWVFPSIPKLNEFSQETFSKYGKVTIKDSNDMSYQVYVFTSFLPAWLKFMFGRYDILPRPAGVGFKIIERVIRAFGFNPIKPYVKPPYGFFGFGPLKRHKNPAHYKFFNFFENNFQKPVFFETDNVYMGYLRNPEAITHTDEQLKEIEKWFKEYIVSFDKSVFFDNRNAYPDYVFGEKPQNVTEEEAERAEEWFKQHISGFFNTNFYKDWQQDEDLKD